MDRAKAAPFDVRALFLALDAQRRERGMNWQQVARGGRLGFPSVMKIVGWLGRPTREFTRVTTR
jgi:hypothetical protein